MKKFFVLVVFAFGCSLVARAEIIVIANHTVQAGEISKDDLHDVFTGNATTLKDGSRVIPVLLNGGVGQEEFLRVYIGKSDAAYRASWRNLVFSGQGTMPKSLEGDAAVVEFVMSHPGAIGYIERASPHAGVKILAVR
jgi:ABC-type phosphate transport system substrate-binding protein